MKHLKVFWKWLPRPAIFMSKREYAIIHMSSGLLANGYTPQDVVKVAMNVLATANDQKLVVKAKSQAKAITGGAAGIE